jgi:hypothetical protein
MKGKPITLWCAKCDSGYGSMGEVPLTCPRCRAETSWSTVRPFKLTVDDEQFLRANKIRPD